jgi:hypothetical protein
MIRTVYGCPATAPHARHDWTSARFGRVSCDGLDTPPAPAAPLTPWQRSERFATMRDAQRQAWERREEADYMASVRPSITSPVLREFSAEDISTLRAEAAQWEHLAAWLSASVRTA